MNKKLVEQIVETNMTKVEKVEKVLCIPSGCTYLNLACSDNPFYAFCAGTFVNVVGGEASGKTVAGKTLFAECNLDKQFDKYQFIYDNPEAIDFFDISVFGERLAKRMKKPSLSVDDDDFGSKTIQDFQVNLWRALDAGPCIYVLDSFDALADQGEIDKMEKKASVRKKATTKIKGNMGMGKAKGASELFRMITSKLQSTKSFLMIVSQTRDEIDPMSMKKKRRNGGSALDFYACHVIWLAKFKKLMKSSNERTVEIGHIVKAKVDKNKYNGKKRLAFYPLYLDYGVDSIASGIKCMQDLNIWGGDTTAFNSPWGKMRKDKLIKHIEDNDLEDEFADFVADYWDDFEDKVKLKRKRKY